jgi:hypothetical protein
MGDPSYYNCTVTVHNEQQLTYTGDFAEDLTRVPLGGDALTLLTIERLAGWVETEQHCAREDLELLGRHLYRCMFGGMDSPVHQRLHTALDKFMQDARTRKDFRLRLTLAFEPAARRLASFPWEFLYVERPIGGFFFSAPDTDTQLVLTRFVPPPPAFVESLEPGERPLKILVTICSPSAPGLGNVDPKMLLPQLNRLRGPQVDVKILPNPRYSDMVAAILPEDEDEWCPDIFHFVGHGDVTDAGGAVAIRFSEQAEEDLFGETGKRIPEVDWIPITKLIELFPAKHLPRLVFLHACRGAMTESYRAFTSAAEAFVKAGVPATIAMRYDIENDDADFFAQQFYRRLGEGWPVDDAVTDARIQLAKKAAPNSWGDRRFGTPLLFLQSRNAIILRPQPGNSQSEQDNSTKSEELVNCPYHYDSYVKCRRLVRYPDDECKKCRNKILWCTNRHPCMSDDTMCGQCDAVLSGAAPPRPREDGTERGRSGFAG